VAPDRFGLPRGVSAQCRAEDSKCWNENRCERVDFEIDWVDEASGAWVGRTVCLQRGLKKVGATGLGGWPGWFETRKKPLGSLDDFLKGQETQEQKYSRAPKCTRQAQEVLELCKNSSMMHMIKLKTKQ
jgi:hypothetical protein